MSDTSENSHYMYILDGHTPVPCNDPISWAEWFYNHDRRIGLEYIRDGGIIVAKVSTVFLGLNTNFPSSGETATFETMIFGGLYNRRRWRCSTWEQAESQHRMAVKTACEAERCIVTGFSKLGQRKAVRN